MSILFSCGSKHNNDSKLAAIRSFCNQWQDDSEMPSSTHAEAILAQIPITQSELSDGDDATLEELVRLAGHDVYRRMNGIDVA